MYVNIFFRLIDSRELRIDGESLLDGCLQSGASQATSEQYSTSCDCLHFLHWSPITDHSHAVPCHKGLRRGRPKTRIKAKAAHAYQLLHNHHHQSTNLEKLIIPTDETSQPIAKSIHKQLSFAATSELSRKRLSCHPCASKTVSPTFTAPTQWRSDGSVI
jgi:hypothetical protein